MRLIREESDRHRYTLAILGDSADKFAPEPYRVVIEWLGSARVRSCTCPCPTERCSHIAAAEIWAAVSGGPEPREA